MFKEVLYIIDIQYLKIWKDFFIILFFVFAAVDYTFKYW